MKCRFITAALFSLSLCIAQAQKKPNIIIVNFDDMGYADTEPYGVTGIATPNFNRIAQQGMRLTHFLSAQPVCSASRASLLTGCYANRVGISGALMPGSKVALNPNEETIASVLKKAGYKTAMLGKWHLGNQAPFFPTHYGFDSFMGIPYSNDIWPIGYDGKPILDPDNIRGSWPPLTLIEGDFPVDTILTLEDQKMLTTLFTNRAVSFIKENAQSSFFLYLAHPMPHVPIAVSEKFNGKSEVGLFGDVIMELDWSVGQILDALEESGISENTLLIITSDNGPWKNFGNHAGSTGGFREGKLTTWDGGHRVPCLVQWPGKVAPGSVCSALTANMDILPTVAAAAMAELPTNTIDGMNFLPLWTGETTKGPREVFYYYYNRNGVPTLEAVRYKNWKLVLPHKSNTYGHTQGKDGYPAETGSVDVAQALYNLSLDPGEVYDIQKLYPEMLAKLLELAVMAREDLGDGITGIKGKNVRLPANLKE